MSRSAWLWALVAVLLLSVGLNLGFLLGRWRGAAPSDPVGSRAVPGGPPHQIREGRGEGPLPEGPLRVGRRLGLADEELEAFVDLQHEFLGDQRELRREHFRVRDELRLALTAPEPDRERIDRLLEESAELDAAMERVFVDHVLASRELLEGEAEERYLRFLGRLARGMRPGPAPRRR